jgi:NAD-dependent deacetylase
VDTTVPITVIDPDAPTSLVRARVIRKGAGEGVAEWIENIPKSWGI